MQRSQFKYEADVLDSVVKQKGYGKYMHIRTFMFDTALGDLKRVYPNIFHIFMSFGCWYMYSKGVPNYKMSECKYTGVYGNFVSLTKFYYAPAYLHIDNYISIVIHRQDGCIMISR